MILFNENDRCSIRSFTKADITNKVKWINNPENNRYLHYNLPLTYDRTLRWFERNHDLDIRLDCIIDYNKTPVGLIGLLNIDRNNKKAEFYICLGEREYKGKGIAKQASSLLIDYAFSGLDLNKLYLYTEKDNIAAQKLFKRLGFIQEGLLREDLIYNNRKVSRYFYGLLKDDQVESGNDNSYFE